MILRIIRVVFVVAGLALLGLGTFLVSGSAKTGGQIHAQWTCEPDPPNSATVECLVVNAGYAGPGDLGDVIDFSMMPLIGIGLIGAAIAIGQFERPRVAIAAPPGQPAVPTGPPPMQPGQQPRWTGQNPGPPPQ